MIVTQPTTEVNTYKHSRFWADPNAGRGFNDFLKAVFSYGSFGASGSTFVNYEIGFDKYERKIYLDHFLTGFPLSIEKNEASSNSIPKEIYDY